MKTLTDNMHLPFPILDAERIVKVDELEEMAPDGNHVRGRTVVEYLSTSGALKNMVRPYFRCAKGNEKVYGIPGHRALCPPCETKEWVFTALKWIALAVVAGILLYIVLPYLIAGAILLAIWWGGKKPDQPKNNG